MVGWDHLRNGTGMTFRDVSTVVFEGFAELLATRLRRNVHTTEDSVRYSFFLAMTNAGIAPERILLEMPHPAISRALIDLSIADADHQELAVEFKYDRPIPSGRNLPRTQHAGKVLADLARLSRTGSHRALMVYVTAQEMAGYWGNPANGINRPFSAKVGESAVLYGGKLQARSKTLAAEVREFPESLEVTTEFATSLPADHQLRIWRIRT